MIDYIFKYGLNSCLRKIRNLGIDEDYLSIIEVLDSIQNKPNIGLTDEEIKRIIDRIYKSFCLIPGKDRIEPFWSYLLNYIEKSNPHDKKFLYPYLAGLLAQTHDYSNLYEFINENISTEKNIDFLLILILELAARGNITNFHPKIFEIFENNKLINNFLYKYSLESHEFDSLLPIPRYHWEENIIILEPEENEQIFGGIKKISFQTHESNNQIEKLTKSFPFARDQKNKISVLSCFSENKLDAFSVWEYLEHDMAEDKDDIFFYKISLKNVYRKLFQLSAYSGNRFTGWYSGLGRLHAWDALHHFVFDEDFINPYQTTYLLNQYTFLWFESGSDWFYGRENDYGLIAISPDETNMKILAVSIW